MNDNPLLSPLRDYLQALPWVKTCEHELIKRLAAQGLITRDFTDALALFKTHFLVFNALYRLSDELSARNLAIKITPLDIQVIQIQPMLGGQAVDLGHDASLREYYLDWSNYEQATEISVDALLDRFWERFGSGPVLESDKQAALVVLGFSLENKSADYAEIKLAYRRLAMLEHPDRGGSTARLQSINDAMALLAHAYGKR